MKRSSELRDLSEEHHHGLVAARRLRRAAEANAPLGESVAQFLQAWRREIQPHFRSEEEVLLPAFARVVTPDNVLIVRTLTEHVALRAAIGQLEQVSGERQQALARAIGLALNDHIRFEERIFFPAIEAALEGAGLAELGLDLKEKQGDPMKQAGSGRPLGGHPHDPDDRLDCHRHGDLLGEREDRQAAGV